MSHQCKRCTAWIPDGRQYCDAHYVEALEEYSKEREQYEAEKLVWYSKSNAERSRAHDAEDYRQLTILAGIVYLAIGASSVFYLTHYGEFFNHYNNRQQMGIGMAMIGVPLFLLLSRPLNILIGKLLRALLYGLIYGVVVFIFVFGIHYVCCEEPYQFKLWIPISAFSAGVLFSLIREINGVHDASAAPTAPTRPSP